MARWVLGLLFAIVAGCSGGDRGRAVPTAPEIDWPDAGALFPTADAAANPDQ